jgi:2-oxoglutarate/2-oxoacid ferredoxin oxidoreductase subunit alpha
MTNHCVNIVIGGEAGQGIVTMAELLSRAAMRTGYHVLLTQSYESRIRGGHNYCSIALSEDPVLSPEESIDILVALNKETVSLHRANVTQDGLIIADQALGFSGPGYVGIPFQEFSSAKYWNSVALGSIACLLGINRESVIELIADSFSEFHEAAIQDNVDSFSKGYTWTENLDIAPLIIGSPQAGASRILINGNQAIAYGAASAGLKFCSFYPMSPATSIAVSLASIAEPMGLIVEQGEDEIAAINMAIGASFAGAPSLVPTSGGGFALMTEAVGLAGMTETPVVVVVAQRPGPSTGLPTRTEQGDLEFVLHAGHGEFPRAILAPGSVEECFLLARRALELAELSRGPVFLLTDQYLADSYSSVEKFDVNEKAAVQTCPLPQTKEPRHLTYALTQSGVSPRLYPGMDGNCHKASSLEQLVIADSDEHTEDGHLTEDLEIRNLMVRKRLKKIDLLKTEALEPQVTGTPPFDLLLVCWGSTRGASIQACLRLGENGLRVGCLHFAQVWPLPSAKILEIFETANKVVCVESNATGQFSRLIRRETGFHINANVLRYDGLPMTPRFILQELRNI